MPIRLVNVDCDSISVFFYFFSGYSLYLEVFGIALDLRIRKPGLASSSC